MSARLSLVKFNGGMGALLCNNCKTIIAHGFKHENKKHYCKKCEGKANVS